MNSCSVDDPKIFAIENATVMDVVAPDTLIFQQNAVFQVTLVLPTDCHTFDSFDVVGDGQSRNIRTQIRFDETFSCEETPGVTDVQQFEFFVENQDDYTFSFLAGASQTGLEYITIERPVKAE